MSAPKDRTQSYKISVERVVTPSGYVDVVEDAVSRENIALLKQRIKRLQQSGGGSLPPGGSTGDLLAKGSSGATWITPASSAEQDNTRPITSAAVYTEIGNINALLELI